MPDVPTYTDEQIDAAVAALGEDADRLRDAQRYVAHAAPQLQQILATALEEGGFFAGAHEEQVLRAAGEASIDDRLRAVRTLIAEETRMGMLIGVAVGFELSRQLATQAQPTTQED